MIGELQFILESISSPIPDFLQGTNGIITGVFCFIIFVIGVCFIFLDTNILRKHTSSLKKLKKELITIFENDGYTFSKFEATEKDCLHTVMNNSILGNTWNLLVRSDSYVIRYNKKGELDTTQVYMTADLRDVFDVDALYENIQWNERRNNMPAIMTGLGILGTFLGLTIGLGKLHLNSTGPDGLQSEINNLISSSGTAFVTSLFGIFFSLIYSWILSSYKDDFYSAFSEVLEYLHYKIPYLSESRVLIDSVDALREEAHSFSTSLEVYGNTLGENISKNIGIIEENFSSRYDSMNSNLLDMSQNIKELASKFSEFHEMTSSKVGEALQKGVGTEIESLRVVLEKFSEELYKHEEERKQTLSELKVSMKNMIDNTEHASKFISDSMNNQYKTICEMLEKKTKSTLEEYERIGDSQRKELDQFIIRMTDATSENAEELQRLARETTENIQKTMKEGITDLIQSLDEVLSKSLAISKSFITQQENARQDIKELSSVVVNVLESSQSIILNMKNIMNETKDVLSQINSSNSLISQNIEDISQVSGKLIISQEKIAESIDTMKTNLMNYIQSLHNELHPFIESLKDLTSETVHGADEIRNTVKELTQAWDGHEESYSDFVKGLEKIFYIMNENIQNTHELVYSNLHSSLKAYDAEISKGIEGLRVSIADFTEAKVSLKDHLEKMDKSDK